MNKLLHYMHETFQTESFNFRLFRLIERLLKYMVIICDIVMTAQCIILLTGEHSWLAEFFCGYSVVGFVAIYLASFLLHFCWRYRLCLVHAFLVNCCITFQREVGFGCCLVPMRWLMFATGVIAIILASYSTLCGKCQHHGTYETKH